MKHLSVALTTVFLLLTSCSLNKNQSPTITTSDLKIFKMASNPNPEFLDALTGAGCACGPTLKNHPSQTQGCTIYLVTEQGELLPSAEVGAVVPFKTGATTCGDLECSTLRQKFARNSACVPFYGFLDKMDEGTFALREDSFSESLTSNPASGSPVEVKRAARALAGGPPPPLSGCGYKNKFSSLNECISEQGKCMDTGWIYVTGCNYYCGGGPGWKACEKPPDFNADTTPDGFNYGAFSSGGQFTWNVLREVVQVPVTVGEGLRQLALSGADCVSLGYRQGSGPVLPACLTSALVGGSIVISVYFPPAAPYVLGTLSSVGAATTLWNVKNCVAPPNYNMEEALKYCREAAADGAMTFVPLKPIKKIATNLSSRLTKTPAEIDKYKKAWCAWGHKEDRILRGNPAKPIENSTILQRADEIKTLQDKGYGKEGEVEGLLNQMGRFFSGDNTKIKFTTVGSSPVGHEMHVVLSNIKKEAEATGQLTLLINGGQAEKEKIIMGLLKKLYSLDGQNTGVIDDFVKNAELFFAAVQKMNEVRFRFKQVPDLPPACGSKNIEDYQKFVDKNLDPKNILSTGVRADGPEGVTSFRWDYNQLKSVVFKIEKSESGVSGVVISGKDKVTAYGTQAQGLLGNPYVPYEKMLIIESGYGFKVVSVKEVPMKIPDGKGNWIKQWIPEVTVKVAKNNSSLGKPGGAWYATLDLIEGFNENENMTLPSSDGTCPVCEDSPNPDDKPTDNNGDNPTVDDDCGYEVWEAQFNPQTCETFWWQDPQLEFQCKKGCVSNFANSGLPAKPKWKDDISQCIPEPWNPDKILGCCEGMNQVKCVKAP